jgi:hypothetical protein
MRPHGRDILQFFFGNFAGHRLTIWVGVKLERLIQAPNLGPEALDVAGIGRPK